jgi:hypothetical protein
VGGEETDDGDELFASTGKYDETGNAPVSGKAVHGVRDPFSTSVSDMALSDDCGEVPGEVRRRGHAYIVDV